jgi:hypothetical protein
MPAGDLIGALGHPVDDARPVLTRCGSVGVGVLHFTVRGPRESSVVMPARAFVDLVLTLSRSANACTAPTPRSADLGSRRTSAPPLTKLLLVLHPRRHDSVLGLRGENLKSHASQGAVTRGSGLPGVCSVMAARCVTGSGRPGDSAAHSRRARPSGLCRARPGVWPGFGCCGQDGRRSTWPWWVTATVIGGTEPACVIDGLLSGHLVEECDGKHFFCLPLSKADLVRTTDGAGRGGGARDCSDRFLAQDARRVRRPAC